MADPRRLSVTMPRDTWLLLLGWIAAKRTVDNGELGFLNQVTETVTEVVNRA